MNNNEIIDEGAEVIDGRVIAALPNAHFTVETKKGNLLSYLGGRMRVHKIRILVGDKVSIMLDEYGGKSRIVRRL
jgi:translation initiation factor IF-1